MCSDRLAVGEAPACVQACPNQAIRIRVVDKTQRARGRAGGQLPARRAVARDHACRRRSTRPSAPFPRNLLPADFYQVRPAHPHLPLVFMLVLTQLSVGAFAVEFLLRTILSAARVRARLPRDRRARGRPARARRRACSTWGGRSTRSAPSSACARPGCRREILAFGAFAGAAAAYAAHVWSGPLLAALHLPPLPGWLATPRASTCSGRWWSAAAWRASAAP